MAIIQCPHCGNNVSDTASSCIHCGKSLIAEEKPREKIINYNDLYQSEQNDLKKEFYRAYPKYKKYDDKEGMLKKLRKIDWILTILGVVLCLPVLFSGGEADLETAKTLLTLAVIGYIVITVSQILNILSVFILRENKKKILLATKKFQKWLKDKKGITYTVTFIGKDEKWKNYFDNINVDLEG